MENYYLKSASAEDLELLYIWANDDTVRENSFESSKITMEEHRAWFENKLQSDSCDMFIYCVNDIPIGQVRL